MSIELGLGISCATVRPEPFRLGPTIPQEQLALPKVQSDSVSPQILYSPSTGLDTFYPAFRKIVCEQEDEFHSRTHASKIDQILIMQNLCRPEEKIQLILEKKEWRIDAVPYR